MRDNSEWEEWVLFMLKGIEDTSKQTINLVNSIRALMFDYKSRIRKKYGFYSQDLMNNLFSHPYTKIEYLERDLKKSRQTVSKYLEELTRNGFLRKERLGRHNFYINEPLVNLFIRE